MSPKAKAPKDFKTMAANLPAPRPGLRFTIRPVEVFLEWHKLHNFEILGWRGDELVIRPRIHLEIKEEK